MTQPDMEVVDRIEQQMRDAGVQWVIDRDAARRMLSEWPEAELRQAEDHYRRLVVDQAWLDEEPASDAMCLHRGEDPLAAYWAVLQESAS